MKMPSWEGSGIQGRRYSTQLDHRNEKRCIKKIKKNSFTLPISPVPQARIAQNSQNSTRELPSANSSPMEERESKVNIQVPQPFGELVKRPTSIVPHPEHWGNLHG